MLQGARAARRGGCVPLLLVLAAVWGATFALSRAHMMLQAYTDFQEARALSRSALVSPARVRTPAAALVSPARVCTLLLRTLLLRTPAAAL